MNVGIFGRPRDSGSNMKIARLFVSTISTVAVLLGLASSSAVSQAAEVPPESILGFSPSHAVAERELETMFQSLPSADKAREWHRIFTANPHPAASAENNRLADVIAREWRKQGWENVTLRRYGVLHSSPRSVTLEMTLPV